MWKTYPFSAGETCCQKTALGFVDSVWEILGPLLGGVRSVIIPDELVFDPDAFVDLLARYEVEKDCPCSLPPAHDAGCGFGHRNEATQAKALVDEWRTPSFGFGPQVPRGHAGSNASEYLRIIGSHGRRNVLPGGPE